MKKTIRDSRNRLNTSIAFAAILLTWFAATGFSIAPVRPYEPIGNMAPGTDAFIRVIHLSPDAPAVDIWVNDSSAVISNLPFQHASTFLTVAQGTYDFDVVPAGGTIDQSVLAIDDVMLAADQYYTVAAYNTLDSITPLALVDDMTPPAIDTIHVRAIHTAAGVGEVDIWLIPEMGSPSPLWVDVPFGAVGNYLPVPAAAFTIGFDVDNDATPDLIFDIPALPSQTIANVFATANSMGKVFLIAQFMDGTTTRIDARDSEAHIRVLHLSPDAPAVDVWVNTSMKAVSELAFPDTTGYLDVAPGTYTFDVAPAGTSAAQSVLTIPDVNLAAGTYITAVAYDFLANITPLALADDQSPLAMNTMRIRAIHTASGVGEVDIWSVPEMGSPMMLWENVGFGDVGGYIETPIGPITVGFDVDNDAVPDLLFDVPTLPSDTIANVFAVRDSTGAVFLIAQLMDGPTVRIDARSTCTEFGVTLSAPLMFVTPGDTFYVKAEVCNPGSPLMDAPFFALLDVGTGEYWFYPSWTLYPPAIDYAQIDIPTGITEIDVIPTFTWPDTGTLMLDNIHIFGAVLNAGLTEIIGTYDVIQFGFGPGM